MADVSTDWVRLNAHRFADAPALRNLHTGEDYTWVDLDRRVGHLAGALQELGIGEGDRVLLIADGDSRTFEVQFACMRLGAIMVPLNWRLSLAELVTLARDAEPSIVIWDSVWQDTARRLGDELGIATTLSWRCDNDANDYDMALAAAPNVEPRTDLPLDRPTHILHTSGTTGTPKGAITTAKTLAWHTFNIVADAGLTGPGCTQLNPMPLFHAGGLTTIAAPMLLTGGCVATLPRFDAAAVAKVLGDPGQGITHFTAPPVMWMMLSEQPEYDTGDFSSLRFAQVAGGVPSLDLLNRWNDRGVLLRQGYGGTELGPGVAFMPADEVFRRPTSCGRAVPFTHVRLVGDDGADVTDRGVGEIWLKGPSVTPGYWRRDAADDHSFVDGWYRTGDAAWQDEDGFFYLVDRKKDMYKSGGENVSPAEVERVIIQHPDVLDVAVIGVAHETWGEVGKAFVVARPGSTLTLEVVREFVTQHIARYKAPHHLTLIDDLPRNTTGKVQKVQLRGLQ